MVKATGIFRTYPAGAVVVGSTVTIKDEATDTSITTDVTDADGRWDYVANGSPGPWYWGATDAAPTPDVLRAGSSLNAGSGGAYSLYELTHVLRAMGTGVIRGYLNALATTDPGTAKNIAYATGGALIQGIPTIWGTAGTHAVATATDVTNTKACYLCIEVVGAGQATEGKAVLKDVCGSAAASPSLPALTQTEALYQYPLATFILGITGATAANSITTLTDVRTYLGTRNPVVSSVVRRTDPTSATTTTSTTGTDVTSLTTTLTLLSGVVYDLEAHCVVVVKAGSGQTVSIAPYLNSVSNIATFVSTDVSSDYVAVGNAYSLAGVTGAGTTIDCGVYWKVSGGTGSAITGYLIATATPRT